MVRFAKIEAGYAYITVEGVEYRVYIEQAGSGIPILLQHTAGSDGRQWRHLLEDEEITRDFRLIAYDLPYHGKSLPPLAVRYWEREYKLTKQWFMSFVVTMARELELDRPVFMGCSMGGHLAPDLALAHPEEFRAVIGVEAAAHSHGGDERRRYLWHPRVSNEAKAAMMHTLCAPTAPEPFRRETIWCYSQGAPAVFKGDLHYYAVEHDVTDTARNIDTGKLDVYILNGDYDWSGTVAAGQALAAEINGAHWTRMEGLGHFPMSEDPVQFKNYLLPILADIRKRSA
ncbi:MAG: alpha/beta hydrolase [Alphaproteobacteria bacterium]|nr:alpha/beta hydrolase [Alphaproteobacteria bacterium]